MWAAHVDILCYQCSQTSEKKTKSTGHAGLCKRYPTEKCIQWDSHPYNISCFVFISDYCVEEALIKSDRV